MTLELPCTVPYDWRGIIGFLAARAIPGVEAVEHDSYRRSFALGGARGVVEVRPAPRRDRVLATFRSRDSMPMQALVARVRRLFDLDADIAAIDAHLGRDPVLALKVRERPGIRVPGAWDGFELAVRAVLGQQITVAAATRFAGRLAAALGERLEPGDGTASTQPHLLFPFPEALARSDLAAIGLTRARTRTLHGLAEAMTRDPDWLRPRATLAESIAHLTTLRGIGPWTAQYIAMRTMREPDAFPATDLGLLRAMQAPQGRPSPVALAAIADAWRPWRAYAALRLWIQADPG